MKKAALRYADLLETGCFITHHEQDEIAKLLRRLAMTVTQEQVLMLFDYKDGNLYWKQTSNKKIKAGTLAGGIDNKGRKRISIKGKSYQAHRLVYLLHYGNMPEMLDHIDGNPLNNKIDNLRPANHSKNGFNRKIGKNNTSGIKGLSWSKKSQKWQTSIKANNKTHYFGYYKYKDIAEIVLTMARQKLHDTFARAK